MKIKKYLLPALMLGSLMPTLAFTVEPSREKSTSIFAEMENPEQQQQARYALDMTVHCAPIVREEKKQALFEALRLMKWDRQAMACGLQYGREIVSDSLFPLLELEARLYLIGDHIEYFNVLHKQYNAHYQGGDLTTELGWRWDNNRFETQELLDSVSLYETFIPEITILDVVYRLASVQREADTKAVLETTTWALKTLQGIVDDNGDALDGLPRLMLSQLLLSLPEFSGGDPLQAIVMLQQQVAQYPQDLMAHRWLIEAHLSERENTRALAVLTAAVKIPAAQLHPQDYVDLAKDLGGIAVRLGANELAQTFSQQRRALLKEKPYLLARKVHASVGHGGANPITGEMNNEI